MDDELRALLLDVEPKVRFGVFLDCCHSGTALDLQHNVDARRIHTRIS